MFELKACIVCLKSDVKVFSMDTGQLRKEYNLVSGLKVNSHNGLPEYLCYQCVAQVRNFKKFRDKCQRTYYALQEVLRKNKEITKSIIEEIDTKILKIEPTLLYLSLNHLRTKYESAQFKWIKQDQVELRHQYEIPVFQYTTTSDDLIFEVPSKKAKLLKDLVEECVKDENETIAPLEPSDENDKAVVDTVVNNSIFDNNFKNCEDTINNDNYEINVSNEEKFKDQDVDGMNLEEEYATMVPISIVEAKAVVEVYKIFAQGKFQCTVCGKGYYNENRLKAHMRMHDQHISGSFYCGLCYYYYRTDFLLKNHMTENHMYKYLCKKCPEVNFDRTSAKHHFILAHLQKGSKNDTSLCQSQTSTDNKENKLFIGQSMRNIKLLPRDFPLYSPITQEEQYAIIKERQKTKNYIDSPFKCEYCYKGFREETTYKKHMNRYDPAHSGELQCDACKIYCQDARKMYKHMNRTHLFKYSCQMCRYVCYSRGQAKMHYKWHKNVTYTCPHCDKEFTKASTRLTHIRIKHPSTYICNLCGHSFVSVTGLYCHKKLAHTKQEVEENAGAPDRAHALYCASCDMQFRDETALATHYRSSVKHANTNLHSAKRHSYWGHFTEITQKHTHTTRLTKGRRKHKSAIRQLEPKARNSDDFPILSAVTQQEQYALIRDRQKTKNYIDSPYKCKYCFKGFRIATTYETHLKKHDPEISGKLQCDACKTYYPNTTKMYKHMSQCHIYKYTCQMCGYVCLNRGQAKIHYNWHKKVIYPCPHCRKEFSKESTKLGHIRKMHPSTNICNLCGHSFVSVTGLHFHKLKIHSKEEVEENPGKVDPNNPLYCAECCVQFRDEEAFNTHLGSSNKHAETNRSMIQAHIESAHESKVAGGGSVRRTDKGIVNMGRVISSNCEICNKYLQNDTQATRHYDAEHPGAPYLKRYMCDICGHKTRQYANLVIHMRSHTQEKPYACPHCDSRFSMQGNRDRHILVHTGERRHLCPHCKRRFSQKNTLKLHIQTVHLKIPYPPWNKKNRKRRKDLDSAPPSPHPNHKLHLDAPNGN